MRICRGKPCARFAVDGRDFVFYSPWSCTQFIDMIFFTTAVFRGQIFKCDRFQFVPVLCTRQISGAVGPVAVWCMRGGSFRGYGWIAILFRSPCRLVLHCWSESELVDCFVYICPCVLWHFVALFFRMSGPACDAGSFTNSSTSMTTCSICMPGSHAVQRSTACMACTAGRYANRKGTGV